MDSARTQAGIDGALLFEEFAADALAEYLGPARARTIVFGTAAAGSFRDKIDALCRHLREGGGFRKPVPPSPVHQKDGGLDVAAWLPFPDERPGQLIVFAQCKTGTAWDEETSRLQPDAFIKKWFREFPVVNPVRAFIVSEAGDSALGMERWRRRSIDAGILFDRCRIAALLKEVREDLAERAALWTRSASAAAFGGPGAVDHP